MTMPAVTEPLRVPANPASDPPGTQPPVTPDATTPTTPANSTPDPKPGDNGTPANPSGPANATPPVTPNAPTEPSPEAIDAAEKRIKANAEEATRQADLKREEKELRDYSTNAPEAVRKMLDKLEEEHSIRFRGEARTEIVDFLTTGLNKARAISKLETGDVETAAFTTADQHFTTQVLNSVDPAKRDTFLAEVRGKDYAAWIKGAQKYAPGAMGVPDLISEANTWGEDADTGLNDTEKAQLAAAVKGAKTAKAVIRAVDTIARARERRAPGAAPTPEGERPNGNQAPSSKLVDPHTSTSDLTKMLAEAGVKR